MEIIQGAQKLRALLEEVNFDIDQWVERQDFLLEMFEGIPMDSDAQILGEIIYLRKGLSKAHEIICIGHELAHHYLHAKCIGYRINDRVLVTKKEREAETLASLILFPSLIDFETERDFKMKSGLMPKTSQARINFFRKTGI